MTLQEYLDFEERSPLWHEYVAGEVYAMSGATMRHNLIGLNVYRRRHVLAYTRHAGDEWSREELVGEGEIPISFLESRLSLAAHGRRGPGLVGPAR